MEEPRPSRSRPGRSASGARRHRPAGSPDCRRPRVRATARSRSASDRIPSVPSGRQRWSSTMLGPRFGRRPSACQVTISSSNQDFESPGGTGTVHDRRHPGLSVDGAEQRLLDHDHHDLQRRRQRDRGIPGRVQLPDAKGGDTVDCQSGVGSDPVRSGARAATNAAAAPRPRPHPRHAHAEPPRAPSPWILVLRHFRLGAARELRSPSRRKRDAPGRLRATRRGSRSRPVRAASGNGSVAFNVAPNTGLARTGTLTVASTTVTVTQVRDPATCRYTLSPGGAVAGLYGRRVSR